jgi:putative CocE/NonD family hydrolase
MVAHAKVAVQNDVPARMRDGVVLRADLYRPEGDGPLPVLLTRTPYGKSAMPMLADSARALAQRGFIVAVQDVRGRFASEGDFQVYRDDMADGYDAVAWAAQLDGANGAVGMFGTSYMGATQFLAATQSPPALKAIMPVQAAGDQYEGGVYCGGALRLADWFGWSMGAAAQTADRLGVDADELRAITLMTRERMAALQRGDVAAVERLRTRINETLAPHLRFLPLAETPLLRDLAPHYVEQVRRFSYDAWWHADDVERFFGRMDTPCLAVGGWYDIRLKGNLDAFAGLRAQARTPEARRAQRLVVGPWTHGQFLPQAGEQTFGAEATLDLLALQTRWFEHWLKGNDSGLLDEPPLRIYVMGANRWRDEEGWPLPDTRYVPYYLHSAGGANTVYGDGVLGPEPPGDEPPDSYDYDPNDPVPTVGGNTLGLGALPGVYDQRTVEERRDVLCFTTPPLPRDLEVTGPLRMILYAATSAPDTDWTAKLVDVHPDGYARNLHQGILRAGHRVPGTAPTPVRPGEVYEYEIDLWATSNVFLAGHCIRLEVSSSNFPLFDRNTNTGQQQATATGAVVARQSVFHDRRYPSHLLLPVIDRAAH